MPKLDENDYRRFTISERINLTIAALSRSDDEEVLRLRRTCERKKYLMLDSEYTDKLENLVWVSTKLNELHNSYYHKMILFTSYMVMHEADEEFAKFQMAYNDQAECILSLYEAFDVFCQEAGLSKSNVMTWLKIDPKPIYDFIGEKALSTLQADPVLINHLKNRFLAIWNGDYN